MIARISRTQITSMRRRMPGLRPLQVAADVPCTTGIRGRLVRRTAGRTVVITLGRDLASVKALDRSHTYQAAVAEIRSKRFPPRTEHSRGTRPGGRRLRVDLSRWPRRRESPPRGWVSVLADTADQAS
jgi:hypothetical protein